MAISDRSKLAIKQGGWIRKMFEVGIELRAKFGDDNVFDLSSVSYTHLTLPTNREV